MMLPPPLRSINGSSPVLLADDFLPEQDWRVLDEPAVEHRLRRRASRRLPSSGKWDSEWIPSPSSLKAA